SGASEGLSGVIFRPARMGGDGYKVTAYFDPSPKKDLDVEGALTAAFKKETGTFEMWREIHPSKNIKKAPSVPTLPLGQIHSNYAPACVRVEDKTTGIETMTKMVYDAAFSGGINAQPAFVKDFCIDKAASQFDGGSHAVTYRNHADMRNTWIAKVKADLTTTT